MAQVIVPEASTRYNTDPAREYGELAYLTDRRVDPMNPEGVVSLFRSRLMDLHFDPEEDFICLTGHQLVTALFLAVAVSDYGAVRVLMFDARTSKYRERVLDTTHEDEPHHYNATAEQDIP